MVYGLSESAAAGRLLYFTIAILAPVAAMAFRHAFEGRHAYRPPTMSGVGLATFPTTPR
ncbi:hypothetical protein L499_A1799 [Bordetella holmesii CDC-H635-BH]|uniref:Uncharacterized protein n=1 Tax=Bordetella holmesii CDC-H585-BH TaxID=1331206 RepID=A0A158M4N5_9BORD|nr:hypothetical protein L503_1774 [Bordetella holmesii CDC-H809-BH]KAK88814.1 hypothetical protein L499_A1799 [Bordetella holmesii CDC-H635-BH]KAK90524.1 hypothetical protein L497_1751 [Bordetella holmesii CDC-H585-BH]KCV06647.1 hypothetical protein L498_0693 [Bordetella holmesii CDC-H629-BH]KCV08952.1 hypothetical protein L502_1787 [Bordetella holmesii CDC-H785-BH]